jgi:hypothetical protein
MYLSHAHYQYTRIQNNSIKEFQNADNSAPCPHLRAEVSLWDLQCSGSILFRLSRDMDFCGKYSTKHSFLIPAPERPKVSLEVLEKYLSPLGMEMMYCKIETYYIDCLISPLIRNNYLMNYWRKISLRLMPRLWLKDPLTLQFTGTISEQQNPILHFSGSRYLFFSLKLQ